MRARAMDSGLLARYHSRYFPSLETSVQIATRQSGAEGLVRYLCETFVTFGIPEELTSDRGPQFKAGKTQECFNESGVRHRMPTAGCQNSEAHAHG